MKWFGRRSKREVSCLPTIMPPELDQPVAEVEKVVLVGQRELIQMAVQRLRERANPLLHYGWSGGIPSIYDTIRHNAYEEMANELYTIAARPWFEEAAAP